MSEESLHRMRHSASHVMAEAVLEMFPDGKTAIGPAIEDGFYYDFDLPRPLTLEDLAQIEARMQERIADDLAFARREMPRAEALELFADQPYKVELIQDLPEDAPISIYTHGGFTDLCAGPHLDSTGQVGAFKLLNVAGAYWRGDEHRPMLQRIYGTAWEDQAQLDDYLWRQEEAARRDHRKLGKELDLFSIHEVGGAGLVCWHPKGARIKRLIEEFWYQEHERGGYEIVSTPHIGKGDLWAVSGHLDFYRENMYSSMDIDGVPYYIKPMNCPYQILIYKTRLHSYRELPLRWAELGTVYRYERSGVLHGLLRVRGFTIDDAHIICMPDQVDDEILGVYNFSMDMLEAFGFQEFDIYLATRPREGKAVGEPARWEQAQAALRRALDARGLPYAVDEGGGAFYGPKIDIKVKDALGRAWQCTTIQFDFNLPDRFDMTYIGEDGQEHRPYMVHRALLGSLERFFGTLIEHYGGAFPVWLSPVQAMVIPIADRHVAYAREVQAKLRQEGIRADVDDSGDRMQAKIRNAQLQKVPYMLVVGDREAENSTVSVRLRSEKNLGAKTLADFMVMVEALIESKEPHKLTLANDD
ncbi:MAG: threonine--tRNA ligase [Chloroflexi bacterium]|nr:threonine--tRNA ligase [Chloroflexota bacterium]MBU1749982.1 threonine--tRNA ligase [Chloroflexota bacterium]MBU1878593.1 threonine--tRNA ligase [Chloroflexota bacterium]